MKTEQLVAERDHWKAVSDAAFKRLQAIVALEPVIAAGGAYYPKYNKCGEEVGEEWANPLLVIQQMSQEAYAGLQEVSNANVEVE